MTKGLVTKYRNWRRYRATYNALMRLSDRELADFGVDRADIGSVARRSTAA